MRHLLWKNLVLIPVLLGTNVLGYGNAIAAEIIGLSRDIKAETEELKVNQQLIVQAKTDENNVLEQVKNYSSKTDNQNSLSQVTSVSLDLQTSFTGQDILHTRIATGNASRLALPGGTFEGTQTKHLI